MTKNCNNSSIHNKIDYVEFEKLIDQSNLIISKFAWYFPTNSKNSFEQTLKKLKNKYLLLKSI